jgi:enoyl-CoA hydratase/carnithine racemase
MSYDSILYSVADNIATITLNRPDSLNAMDPAMINEIICAFDEADADDAARAVVVTGAGRGFCAGASFSKGPSIFDKGGKQSALREDGTFDYSSPAARDAGGLLALRIYQSLKPVIAAINGPAAGVGAAMTLPMDVRIASNTAKMGFVYSRRGIVWECCSSWFLPRVVGINKALEWGYSGRIISAQELKDGGLLRDIVPPEELLPTAYAVAREIAENTSPVSVALIRQMAWQGLGMNHPMEAHKIESRGICARGRSADAKEGVASFLEKRKPRFESRVSTDMPDFFPWWEEPEYS